jgi:hypothetical protein
MLGVKNRKVFFLLLGVVLAGTAAQSRDSGSSKELIGRWDGMIRLADGSGQTLQFSSDGSVGEFWDYEVQGSYHLKDSQLSISTWRERNEKKRLFEAVINGKQVILKESANGQEINLTQVCTGKTAGAGFVGEWFSDNFPGAVPVVALTSPLKSPAFVEFTKEGDVYLRSAPVKSKKGSYEVSRKKVIFKIEGEPPLELKPRIASKKLDIHIFGDKTPDLPFRRIEGSECGVF